MKEDLIINDGLDDNIHNKHSRKFRHFIKKTFPHLTTEIIMVVALISIFAFAFTFKRTATIGHEMEIMAAVEKMPEVENATNIEEPIIDQEVEFEVNDVNTGITQADTEQILYQPYEICFIGDDRVVDMQNAILTETRFIAGEAADVEWLKNEAMVDFTEISKDIKVCVISMGLNDLSNADIYVSELNNIAMKYPHIKFVYSNVGPIKETEGLGFTNSNIETFNTKIENGLSDAWTIFDTYGYLSENGFESNDGVKYSLDTSASAFVWIVNGVSKEETDNSIENVTETVENTINVEE